MAGLWGGFDRIYCISLQQRTDRRERARREFVRVGLTNQVQFVLVQKDQSDSERGIFESHMSCLRAAIDSGAQRIAVFEDDIHFCRFSPDILEESVRFMKTSADWRLFFFGCFVKRSWRTSFRSVLRVKYRCNAHAYVMHRKFADELVDMKWQGIAYDDLLRDLDDGRYYTCYPAFGFQTDASTDNDKTLKIDRYRRLIGGQRRLQRWDEFSKHHAVGLVVGHTAFLLVVLFIWLICTGRI